MLSENIFRRIHPTPGTTALLNSELEEYMRRCANGDQ